MTFLEKLQLIERMDALIKRKGTGTASELASRLGVSRSTVYEILDTMRIMGAEIEFCKYKKTYFYSKEKVLAIGFVTKDKLKGGKKNKKNIVQSGFFGLSRNIFALESVFKGKNPNPPDIIAQ